MDEKYDVVFLGTGLKECVLAGLLGKEGKKILHMDRNSYYGAETTSFTPLDNLFKFYDKPMYLPDKYGKAREWNVDKIPKFLMADGNLVKLLIHTKVTRYIDFKVLDCSYVCRSNTIYKVPSNDSESLKTGLLGMFEKIRYRDFLKFVAEYDEDKPETHLGIKPLDPMINAYKKYKLTDGTMEITGHAIALNLNDDYLHEPAIQTIKRIQLYFNSLCRHGKSPFLYPLYGIGELPQGFARLSAVYGGTYMLNKPVTAILYDESGKVKGVQSGDETVQCDTVVCDPSYAQDQCEKRGRVIRAIYLLNHPVRNTDNSTSCQIIIPRGQVNRKNDIFVAVVSSAHGTTAENWYVAMASTVVETKFPKDELLPVFSLLTPIDEVFYEVFDLYEPTHDGTDNRVIISKSYDATSHFELTCIDIMDMYKRITGREFDFSKLEDDEKNDDNDDMNEEN